MEIVIYDEDTQHNRLVKDICFRFAIRENVDGEIHVFETGKEMKYYVERSCLQKLIMAGIGCLKKDRIPGLRQEPFLILMGVSVQELIQAVTPGFRPAGLLLKPVEKDLLESLLLEIKEECAKENAGEDFFYFRSKAQEYLVPKDKILYFESRSKKIVLRTETQEIDFYDTLDHLKEELGDDFIRVHKSFLVNLAKVQRIHFSNRMIHFSDGTFVPLSRTYKAELSREWERRKEGHEHRISVSP